MKNFKANRIHVVISARSGILWLFLIGIFILGCNTKTFNNDSELLAHLKNVNNGFTQQKSVNGISYTLMYRPTDLLVAQELGDSISADINQIRSKALREKYDKYMYFNLSISKNNRELLSAAPKNRNEFGGMVNQLVFGMKNKVHLYTSDKDTLDMVDFVYPRMYGMSKATTIMFVYPREREKLKGGYINFAIEDLGLYTGEVKFKIDLEKIINEPTLSL